MGCTYGKKTKCLTNTLIHNYAVVVDSENFVLINEVDEAKWFKVENILSAIKPNSLVKSFVERYLKKICKIIYDLLNYDLISLF